MEPMEQLKLENQLCFPLYASARKVVSFYTPVLKPLDLTYTQYITLMVLWEQESATVGELCRRLYLDNGTLTPLLKKMEEKGLIIRTRKTKDERVVTVSLTQAGWDLREKAAGIPAQVGSCVKLEPQEAIALYQILYKIMNAAQEDGKE